jgi:hypothetical protein
MHGVPGSATHGGIWIFLGDMYFGKGEKGV